MIKSNKVDIFFIGLFILIAGCEKTSLELSPSNGQALTRTLFTLSSESETAQDSVIIGSSKTLYAGYIEDKLSTILLSLDYDNLQEHPICKLDTDSLKNIENIQFEFKSLQPLMDLDSNLFIDKTALSIGLSLANSWSEGSDIADINFLNFSWNIDTMLDSVIITENSLQVTIVDTFQLLEWCNSQDQYLIIKYEPELNTLLENELKLLEFYSSEFTISYRPQVGFDYFELEATAKSTNKFLIEEITSEVEGESSVHIVDNIESEAWSRIYLFNVADALETNLDSSIVTYNLSYNEMPIINSGMLNQQVNILKLTIALNDEIIDSIDAFNFSILPNSIIAHSNSVDLSGDNYTTDDTLGTEGNFVYDQYEEFLDFGIDACPDQFESGDENPCIIEISEFENETCTSLDENVNHVDCIYNSLGREGNLVLDWEDLADVDGNFNGIWDDGEGEPWIDVGSDGCMDAYEDGEGGCLVDANQNSTDLNGDNFNIDPVEDDYDELENPSGTEGDLSYQFGEPFFDIGCDGIPQIVDDKQGNGTYDSCEPFNDTGIDGKYSHEEAGYNSTGTEGNLSYQFGEPFDDFGVDNIEDGTDGDDPSDNYNIDPNGDNEDGDGNGVIDWNDTNQDGLYNVENEIGEYFYDFGSDGVSDAGEVFSESNFLNIETGHDQVPGDLGPYNNHTITNGSEEILFPPQPELESSDALLWISEIKPLSNNRFDLTFSVYAVKEVKSLFFSLTHDPLDWVDTTFVPQSFFSNNYSAKFVDDISVYEVNFIENSSELSLNYGHGITSKVYFENIDPSRTPNEISLGDFIDENRNVLLSGTYTQLVLPIDVENSDIDEFGANLVLSGVINEEAQPLISINISQDDERIIIPMSTLLQKYINGQYVNYAGFELSLDGAKYNFSNIVLIDSTAYLEIVHSQ